MSFIKNMLSGDSEISSKRTSGMILILVFVLGTIYATFITRELTNSAITLLTTSAYLGTVLLGITLVEKLKKL